ncbi:MAG: hypothetical protein WCL51_03820 [Bacteroidota bacterium]
MTKKELSQLHYLNKEIERQKLEYEKIKTAAEGCTTQITGMPHASGVSDKIGNFASEMADLKAEIELNMQKCWYEIRRLNRFIETIEDADIRLMIRLRFINHLTFEQIGFEVGYDGSQVRRKINGHLGEEKDTKNTK